MRIYDMETLSGALGDPQRPLQFVQRFSHGHRRVRAIALAIAGGLLCAPFAVILTNFEARQQLIDLAMSAPLSACQLSVIAIIGVAALFFGLRELLQGAVRKRIVTIEIEDVVVEDVMRFRNRRWQRALGDYKGIRHIVQTRSSGPVHLLILEHESQSHALCIAYETHMPKQAIMSASRHFKLPVLVNSERKLLLGLATLVPNVIGPWGRLWWGRLWGRSNISEAQAART